MGAVAGETEAQCVARINAAANNYSFKSPEAKDLAKAVGLLK